MIIAYAVTDGVKFLKNLNSNEMENRYKEFWYTLDEKEAQNNCPNGMKVCAIRRFPKWMEAKLRKAGVSFEEKESKENHSEKINPEYLFKKLNKKCIGCKKNCKQSYKAIISYCPDYEKIN